MATAYAPARDLPEWPAARGGYGYRRARFTAEEFLRMGELGALAEHRLELADGELVEKPMHGVLHARLHARMMVLLSTAAPADCIGMGVLSIRLSDRTVRDFDAGLVRRDTPPAPAVEPAAVQLAVEVSVTTLATDLEVKSVEYGAAGIPTYWVVDANAEVTHVMTGPGRDGYARRVVVRFDEPLAVPGGGAIVIAERG